MVDSGIVISMVNSEVQAGQGISLSMAGRKLPGFRGNKHVDGSTVWRWARIGSRDADGNRVKLEICRVGGRWLFSEQALARFVARLSGPQPNEQPHAPRTPTARRRASDAAVAELERMGA